MRAPTKTSIPDDVMDHAIELINRNTDKASDCWIWKGRIGAGGYGCISLWYPSIQKHVEWRAHRLAYLIERNEVPPVLDHRCRNRKCVNPSHLVPTSNRLNVLMGVGITAQNSRKTHCKKGHQLMGSNLFARRDGNRDCKECHREWNRQYRTKMKHAKDVRSGL